MTGRQTAQGFVPNEPTTESIFESLQKMTGGWNNLNKVGEGVGEPSATAQEAEDLAKSYVQVFGSPAGQRVLEDLLDVTLRRSSYPADMTLWCEAVAMHGRFRQGQNEIVTYVLSRIHAGKNIKPAKAARGGAKGTK